MTSQKNSPSGKTTLKKQRPGFSYQVLFLDGLLAEACLESIPFGAVESFGSGPVPILDPDSRSQQVPIQNFLYLCK